MKHYPLLTVLTLLLSLVRLPAQPAADLERAVWPARWISVPGTGPQDYGVYYFRKDVDLAAVPADFIVHVTGDNRYKLYVNGELVSLGPAKGDVAHWRYETVDLAPYLKAGKNVLAALVYHEGPGKPDSQISLEAGFLLQGEGNASELRTDRSWKCLQDAAYSPVDPVVNGYYVAGPGERVDLAKTPSDWLSGPADGWLDAREGPAGKPKGVMYLDDHSGHLLVPSPLPQMERTPFTLGEPFTVPPHTSTAILLDNRVLTNAYVSLSLSGGRGAAVHVGYAEALYLPDGSGKGNRNEVEGKVFVGREDILLPDGGGHRWTTLGWRTFRYIRLQVETAGEPLTIGGLTGTFTGYPFTWDATLETDRQDLKDIFAIGWRSARLCAMETYMDCPYYEQLQYLGDTRIQALVTLFSSRDDRLVKNFLHLADISRDADGMTKSRYPTTIPQYIQPYALSYIYALHDYLMYGADTDFVLDLIPGAEQIIHYFQRFQLPDGRIRNLPGWNFSDWVNDRPSWHNGAPRLGADGCSINMDLQLLYAYQMMADLEEVAGNSYLASDYRRRADQLAEGVKKAYWNPERGLFADRSEQDDYSQHGNALAILCGIADDPAALARKLQSDPSLGQCTIYYKFYLYRAYVKAGLGDEYLDWLDAWRENIAMGLTTWGEDANVFGTRSDCHAWGSSPNIELFRTVMGIDSDAVAFRHVRIEPHLGDLQEIGGEMPHPSGSIRVRYQVKGKKLRVEITLPDGVDGVFVWKGRTRDLHGGKNVFTAS